MTVQQEYGRWAEDLARDFLLKQGFEILALNWRYKRAEIDIIGKEKEVLVFIEVKMRSYSGFGLPEEMVSKRKQRLLIDAAMAYMRTIGHEWEIRFDIIAVMGSPDKGAEIKHFRDAFFPGLDY